MAGDFSQYILSENDKPQNVTKDDSNAAADLVVGIYQGLKAPVDGTCQILGAQLENKPHEASLASTAGHFIGSSALFIGTSVLAKRLPGAGQIAEGRLASVTAGGLLGFTAPLSNDAGLTERLVNGATGAAAMGILEFGPGAIGRIPGLSARLPKETTFAGGLTRYAGANAVAGAVHTEGTSLAINGRLASAEEMLLGTAMWTATGAAMHTAARPFVRMQQEAAEARKLTDFIPWQHKEVQQINAAELTSGTALKPGHYNVAFDSQGHSRAFNLYVSDKAATANGAAPLVTFLHGLNPKGESHKIIRELSFNKFADDDGAVVAYLHARDGRKGPLTGNVQNWNDRGFGYTKPDSSYSDRVAFDDMLRVIKQHVPGADGNNVAVTGFSLGGKMANRIAGTREDVGALATIHGTMDRFDQSAIISNLRQRPLDSMFVLGDKDGVLPMNGGKSLFTMLLENSGLSRPRSQAEFWSTFTGADNAVVTAGTNSTRRDWLGPSARVSEIIVKDGQHAIHGAHQQKNLVQAIMGKPQPADYFDARRTAWDFVLGTLRRQNGEIAMPLERVTNGV